MRPFPVNVYQTPSLAERPFIVQNEFVSIVAAVRSPGVNVLPNLIAVAPGHLSFLGGSRVAVGVGAVGVGAVGVEAVGAGAVAVGELLLVIVQTHPGPDHPANEPTESIAHSHLS